MEDPIVAIGAGLAILGSKDILTKLLGPTADYIGGEVAGLVEKCNINVDNIFIRTAEKLGDRIERPGTVNPRVLKHVLDEGRFCEDELTVEYYAGMLAGSRGEAGLDDSCIPMLDKVRNLSSYQLKLHFIFYYELLRLHKESNLDIGKADDITKCGLLLPYSAIFGFLGEKEGTPKYWERMAHSVVGLSSAGLVNAYAYGSADDLKWTFPEAKVNGAYLEPNYLGAELFLWALGGGQTDSHLFFETDINDVELVIPVQKSAMTKD